MLRARIGNKDIDFRGSLIRNEEEGVVKDNYILGMCTEFGDILFGYDAEKNDVGYNLLVGGKVIDDINCFFSYFPEGRPEVVIETSDWAKYEKMRMRGGFEDRFRRVKKIFDEDFWYLRDMLRNDYFFEKGLNGRVGINERGVDISASYGFKNLVLRYDSETNFCDIVFRIGPFYVGNRFGARLEEYFDWKKDEGVGLKTRKETDSIYRGIGKVRDPMMVFGFRF